MTKIYKGGGFFLEIRERQLANGNIHYDILNSQGEPYAYAARLIKSAGGIEQLLGKCFDSDRTVEDLERENGYTPARSIGQRKVSWQINKQDIINFRRQSKIDYTQLLLHETNETTTKNICTILRHCLQHAEKRDWGELPKLSMAYSVRSFPNIRRGVKIGYYVTAKTAEPIDYHGTMQDSFILGRKTMGIFKNVDFEDGLKPMPIDGINPNNR